MPEPRAPRPAGTGKKRGHKKKEKKRKKRGGRAATKRRGPGHPGPETTEWPRQRWHGKRREREGGRGGGNQKAPRPRALAAGHNRNTNAKGVPKKEQKHTRCRSCTDSVERKAKRQQESRGAPEGAEEAGPPNLSKTNTPPAAVRTDVCAPGSERSSYRLRISRRPDGRLRARRAPGPCGLRNSRRPDGRARPRRAPSPCRLRNSRRPDGRVCAQRRRRAHAPQHTKRAHW